MQIQDEHIKLIRESLSKVQDKRDLKDLFRLGENLLFGEQQPKIKLKTLTFYAHPYRAKKRYHTFTIKKKSGKDRIINAPNDNLKYILRVLNFILQAATTPHRAATGFVLGKSIVDNARMHVGKRYVYNMDLKDFFHSFDRKRVKSVFMQKPFNFTGDKEPLAYLLSGLVTHPFEIDGETHCVLPQGSPTSPTLTNLLSKKLDRRLTGLANRFGLTYTRYADDISFSSNHNVYRKKEFLDELERIITELDLEINPEKTRLQYMTYQQEITGLIVNEKVNVKRRYIKQIRQWLYFWEQYGYEKAQELFLKAYKADKGHVKKGKPDLQAVLDGKLLYLKMVKGVTDPTYIKLQNRLNRLVLNIKSDELEYKEQKYYNLFGDNKYYNVEGDMLNPVRQFLLTATTTDSHSKEMRLKELNQSKEWTGCVLEEKEKLYNHKKVKSYWVGSDGIGKFWFNEMDFIKHKSLYKEVSEECDYVTFNSVDKGEKKIIFKGPFDKYYKFIKRIVKGKKETIILPKEKITIENLIKKGYNENKSKQKNLNRIIQEEPHLLNDNKNSNTIIIGDLSKENKSKEEIIEAKLKQLDLLTSSRLNNRDRQIITNIIKKDLQQLNKKKKRNEKKEKRSDESIKKHSPMNMVYFLYQFSINTTLKKLTHEWDNDNYEKNYEELLNKNVEKEFIKISKDYKINKSTQNNCKNFIGIGKEAENYYWLDYYNKPIKYNWKKLLSEKSLEKNYNPFDYEIRVGNDKYFRDIVKRFKNTIEFRLDSPYQRLYYYIKTIIKSIKIKDDKKNEVNFKDHFNIEFHSDFDDISKRLNTYIDKHLLYSGISKIFKWIGDYKGLSREIFLKLQEKEKYYELIILHKNSYIARQSNDKKILGDGGTMKDLRQSLFCVVDLEIQAKFLDDNFYKLILLSSDTTKTGDKFDKNKVVPIKYNPKGVRYILKIYKNI